MYIIYKIYILQNVIYKHMQIFTYSEISYIYIYIIEKGMATHSSILAWRIPWTEDPGELESMGSQRFGHNWVTNTHTLYIYTCKSPNTNPQVVSFQRCKCEFTCSIACQFTCLACVVRPLQLVVLLCILLYIAMWSAVVQDLYFKCRLGGSKHKSSSDVAGTAQKRLRKW